MSSAPRDPNRVPTMLGESDTTAGAVITAKIDETTERLLVNTTVTGTITVSSTNLDIRDLTSASDSVLVYGDIASVKQFDLANSKPLAVGLTDFNGNMITSFPSPTGINGGPVTVGTTAVEMTFTGTTRVISLKSASTNTGLIWFGPATVDNTGANAFGELTADSAVEIELDDSSVQIYAVSDTAAQKVYKVAIT